MRALRVALALACVATLTSAHPAPPLVNDDAITAPGLPRALSEYRFFTGTGTASPSPQLIGYGLRSPLFSDYTEKQRFVYLPAGQRATVRDNGEVAFPQGAAIIKTFGVGQGAGFRPIETRVLLHRASGWEALPYVWNADGSDAALKVAGTRLALTVSRTSGAAVDISYAVPNKNQCKECHQSGSQIVPIGPVWMNMAFADPETETRFISRATMPGTALAKWPVWDDPKSGPLAVRARAYLHSNCAHCHNPAGSASNSGLYLSYSVADADTALGPYKRPVAAGRGSGGHDFAIAPGAPERSIMVHRMNSTEPGVAMPEVGRSLVHDEGVALIRSWIASLPAK
ncbi:SO2930 family diheme c-type cytochrome [Blastomonas sp.]|uniref:SO2930 family diheme c-type cytochrome n=1 Tax=Blastomonas sp. TaxID=1909299 RepID=UPI0026284604|nr:SO2930 family diheme c-type cytochrome [Blastomonas sp.]MDM7956227.1 SO2930 family diheme c-type cytochrome [Blastomonas sp.]